MAKNTYMTRYFGTVGNTLPTGWVHQSHVARAMIHNVFEGRQLTLHRHIVLIRSNPLTWSRRHVFDPLEVLVHGTVTVVKTPEVLVDILIATGSDPILRPQNKPGKFLRNDL